MPTDDRPLARSRDAIKKRYDERYEIYKATADVRINAGCGPDEVANLIIEEA